VRSAFDQVLLFEPVEDEGGVGRFAVHPAGQLARHDRLGQFAQRDDLGRVMPSSSATRRTCTSSRCASTWTSLHTSRSSWTAAADRFDCVDMNEA